MIWIASYNPCFVHLCVFSPTGEYRQGFFVLDINRLWNHMMVRDHLPSIADNKPGTSEINWRSLFMDSLYWPHRSNSNNTTTNFIYGIG